MITRPLFTIGYLQYSSSLVGRLYCAVGSEAVSLEMDSLRDLVFWVSRRANAQVLVAPIQLSLLVNTHRKKLEEDFKQYLQKSLAPKLMMGQSVAVDEAYIRDEFSKYERDVLSKEPWYSYTVLLLHSTVLYTSHDT